MSTLLRVFVLGLAFFSVAHESLAYTTLRERQYLGRTSTTVTPSRAYQYSGLSSGVSCNFSNASVWVGILMDGVTVMIDSPDATLTRCIKDNSWTSYFTRYGNNVTISTDYTTRGVQIIATSGDAQIISDLQNAQWSRILRSAPRVSTSTQSPIYYYDTPSYNSYHGNNYNNNYNNSPQYNYQPYTYNPSYYTPTYPTWSVPTTPVRNYRAGSTVFSNYSQISRGIAYINNGVQMTFTSPDYRTMLYLQGFYFTGLFSDFSGISVGLVNVSGGVQVTVTSGSTSTIDEIQKIGYALVYR